MQKKLKNVNLTRKDHFCCGCGLCSVACPDNAIEIKFDKNKEFKPYIDEDRCNNCGLCIQVCPMSIDNLSCRIKEAMEERNDFGLRDLISVYKGYEVERAGYIKSSSGGMLSALLKYLLEERLIDAVVHAQQLYGSDMKMYFNACISTTTSEIEDRRGSFYYPIEFSGVLKEIRDNEWIKRVAFVGTPCVLSGIKNLKEYDEVLNNKIKHVFSLMCSHNVNGQFADCITNYFSHKQQEKKLSFRNKEGIDSAKNFNNSIRLKNGSEVKESRFKTPFTRNWGVYAYALNACLFCPDFIGQDSDAAFKDAWGFKNLVRKEGETLCVVKNKEINDLLSEMKDKGLVNYHDVGLDEFKNSQKVTLYFKTQNIDFRIRRNRALYKKLKNNLDYDSTALLERFLRSIDYRIKKANMLYTKFLSRTLKIKNAEVLTRISYFLLSKISHPIQFVDKLRTIHLTKLKERQLEIIYSGGFGYRNVGDEAQLAANLDLWGEYIPNSRVTILSPKPEYTREIHGNYDIIKAPRITFWGLKDIQYAGVGELFLFKYFFMWRYFYLRFNAFFLKHFGFTPFLGPERSYLLNKIKNADVLHIGGGGYLTGKTESRLYDNMGLIKLTDYFNTDVILTGHTIGVWKNNFQRLIAKYGLKKAKYIGVRDQSDSVEDLKETGICDKDKVLATFDDALFCKATDKSELEDYFKFNNINADDKYIVVHAHYWKVDAVRVNKMLYELAKICDWVKKMYNYNIVLLPMHPSDKGALSVIKSEMKEKSSIFNSGDDFRLVISLIQHSEICITMKHHPIVFAMGAGVPTLSIAFEEYYNHKNRGALGLFAQSDFARMGKDLCFEVLKEDIAGMLRNRPEISNQINLRLTKYKEQNGLIIRKYLEEYHDIKVQK